MDNELKTVFIEAGIKMTDARCAIVNILAKNKGPKNYEEIKKELPFPMNKTTFYRNMFLFEEKGLINKFESSDRIWYYELGKSSHAHFMCEICSKIECFDIEIPSKLKNYQLNSVTFKGICKDCLNNRN